MRYIKFSCDNGLPSCAQEFYKKFSDETTDKEIVEYSTSVLEEEYGFFDDDRFIEYEDYDDPNEAETAYHENCCVDWEELSEEEWKNEAIAIL